MKVIAFGASSSSESINKQLATYAVSLLDGTEAEVLDLNDYELPLFSVDKEKQLGQPQLAKDFLSKIASADALVISFAEHNGSYSAAYKSLFDWCSRIEMKVWQGKPIVMLSASPGKGGAANVLAQAKNSAPHFDGEVVASLSIPSFYDNFDQQSGRLNQGELHDKLVAAMQSLTQQKKVA